MGVVHLPKIYHPDFSIPNRRPVDAVEHDPSFGIPRPKRVWLGRQLYSDAFRNRFGVFGSAYIGAGDYTSGTSGSLREPNGAGISGAKSRTLLGVIRRYSISTNYVFHINPIAGGNGSAGARWTVRVDSGSLRIEIQGSGYTSSLSVPVDQYVFIGCRFEGTQLQHHTLFVGDQSQAATGTSSVNTDSGYAYRLMDIANGSGSAGVKEISWLAFWDTALTNGQIARIRRDNFGFLRPISPISYFIPAAGGADASVSFAASSNVSFDAQVVSYASHAAAVRASVLNSAIAQALGTLPASIVVSDQVDGSANANAVVEGGAVLSDSASGAVAAGAGLGVDVVAGDSVVATVSAFATLSFDSSQGYTVTGSVESSGVLEVSVSVAQVVTVSAVAQAQAFADVLVTESLAVSVLAEAAASAGISVGAIANVSFSASVVSGDITTPDGRVCHVSARLSCVIDSDSRTSIPTTSRTNTIN